MKIFLGYFGGFGLFCWRGIPPVLERLRTLGNFGSILCRMRE